MSAAENIFDLIIIGGGLAGCTLAALLQQSKPSLKILLIEAGPDVSEHPLTQAPLACFGAHFSPLDWNYSTVAQTNLDNRQIYQAAGKALSGGTATNYGTWTRGSKFDYDRWAQLVGDASWSYEGLLPYLNRLDTKSSQGDEEADKSKKSAPIVTVSVTDSSSRRKYPLRDRVLQAWQGVGHQHIADANSGYPLGVAEMVENWRDGKRQIASKVFDLSGVTVKTNTLVQKVIIEIRNGKPTATGVQLADGKQFFATKEVIVSAGAYRTPQILMLSGIGPAKELHKQKIPVNVESPGVGQNFHDHLLVALAYRLRDPSSGYAIGGSAGPWADPAYQLGLPCDWIVTGNVPSSAFAEALKMDKASNGEMGSPGESVDFPLNSQACHLESLIIYAPAGMPITNTHVPFDGTHIGAIVSVMSPTSRGSVTLSSDSPLDSPSFDPNYNATEVDRALMRYGVRQILDLVHSSMSDVIDSETPPPGLEELKHTASDADIDARVRSQGRTFFHAGGTASMGTVVDTELRVKGVDGLRVVDASVIPVPIAGHYQVVTYAIATRAAEMIAQQS